MRTGYMMRQQAIAAVYAKVLRLNSASIGDVSAGKARVLAASLELFRFWQKAYMGVAVEMWCTCLARDFVLVHVWYAATGRFLDFLLPSQPHVP